MYGQEKLEYKHNFTKQAEQLKDDDLITDSHVTDKLRYALIDLWLVNPQLLIASPFTNFRPPPNFTKCQKPVEDREIAPYLQ